MQLLDGSGPLPTYKVPGVVSLNVLRAYLEGMSHPGWRERYESWPEVPVLRLRCAELFPAQPFAAGTIELLMAWFRAHGLTPDQARHLPLDEAVRRLDRQAADAVPDLLDYAIRVRDELDDETSIGRDDGLNLVQVRKVFVGALELGLVRESECPDSPLSRDGARRKLDALIPLIRGRLRLQQGEGDGQPQFPTQPGCAGAPAAAPASEQPAGASPAVVPATATGKAGDVKAEEITNSLKEFLAGEFARFGSSAGPPVDPPPPPARVRCDSADRSVHLDGKRIASGLSADEFQFVSAVVAAYPDPVTFDTIMGGKTQGKNPTRICTAINTAVRGSLPLRHPELIKGTPKGYRLRLPPR
ncbi:hypothetical protein J0H58_19590 [bacterium]|nr:hypothetical protein [bacterium]